MMMGRRTIRSSSALSALLIGLSLVLAACGGATDEGDGAADPEPTDAAGEADGEGNAATPAADAAAGSDDDGEGADDRGEDAGGDATEPARPSGDGDTAHPAGDCSAAGAEIEARPAQGLPEEVVATRDFLLDAALRCDEQLLRTAMDESDQFTHSFGADGEAIGTWWEMEEAGQTPFLRMAQLLGTTPALVEGGDIHVWPQVATGRAENTTEAAWAELSWLDDPAGAADDAGGYLDWRLGISSDGQWRFFVAGD